MSIHILLITFSSESKLVFFHKVKWFQVLLCITNISIKLSFLYTRLNDQTVPFQTIQFGINHSFALSLNVDQFCLIHR